MHIKKTSWFKLVPIKIFGLICLSSFINSQAQQVFEKETSSLETSYLESKDELKDYILDTGDTLNIKFFNLPELSGFFTIDEQGEIYLERLKHTYIRGLTIKELTELLEKRYEEFLIDPEIYIIIYDFKPIRVSVKGEVRAPGLIKFPPYSVTSTKSILSNTSKSLSLEPNSDQSKNAKSKESTLDRNYNIDSPSSSYNEVKRENDYVTTLSNAIRNAGGLTSYSDISKIEIIRDVPLGKGGGKKRALIDFSSYITNADNRYDIRLFDGDSIFIPTLLERDTRIIPNSILSGLSPKFITIEIAGKIENPGSVRIPIEGTLSDVLNLSGPRKPLSGKIYLIRYNQDGTLLRKSINYSANAEPGSIRNPLLVSNDLIVVRNSILGRASGVLKEVTEPFLGIYTTKKILDEVSGK